MNNINKIPMKVVVGPTASGKTNFSINLAKKINGEIVSADSIQIYKQMNIGTAKPTKAEMKEVPHHLIGFLDITEEFCVANYVDLAHKSIKDIYKRGKIPIVCGGTGLYISSLVDNIKFGENNFDYNIRRKLEQQLKLKGINYLLERLKKIDYESYERLIVEKNPQRIIRAIEIYSVTGNTMTFEIKNSKKVPPIYELEMIGINFKNRENLYAKINQRVDIMFKKGLENEAKQILRMPYSKTAMNAIGYKELIQYFDGNKSLDECIEKIKIKTRRYAKRQITWFNRDNRIKWILKD